MSALNFDAPAKVVVAPKDHRPFATLAAAIHHVMEVIPEAERSIVTIFHDGGSLDFDEIEAAYDHMKELGYFPAAPQ
jgi:hypothetical protein